MANTVSTDTAPLRKRLDECRRKVEAALDAWMPPGNELPSRLHEAMRYSVFAGGKRLRPFLVLECCRVAGGDEDRAMPAACAVEVLHTHSLVHDDLPCMDDDDLRRGRPTCHKVYGDGMAVLAGDALLTLAFEWLARRLPEAGIDGGTALRCVAVLTDAAGSHWLCGGQAMDITEDAKERRASDPDVVLRIHERKTAALMRACCEIGGLAGNAAATELASLREYGYWLGLTFQITDDILDVTGDVQTLGKSVGKDDRQEKLTYPAAFGLERSRELAAEAAEKAIEALAPFGGRADLLRALARLLLERQS